MEENEKPYLLTVLVFTLFGFLFVAFLASRIITLQSHIISYQKEHYFIVAKLNESIDKINRLEVWTISLEKQANGKNNPIGVAPSPILPFDPSLIK